MFGLKLRDEYKTKKYIARDAETHKVHDLTVKENSPVLLISSFALVCYITSELLFSNGIISVIGTTIGVIIGIWVVTEKEPKEAE